MTQMRDTEGGHIPKDGSGSTYFDADLCDWNTGLGPELTINVPVYFEGGDGDEYSSDGVLTAPLQTIMEEYLVNFKETDGGDGIHEFAKWLRTYADRLEDAMAKEKSE